MNTCFAAKLLLKDNINIEVEILSGEAYINLIPDDERRLPGEVDETIQVTREELKDLANLFTYAWTESAPLMRKAKLTGESNDGSSKVETNDTPS